MHLGPTDAHNAPLTQLSLHDSLFCQLAIILNAYDRPPGSWLLLKVF